MHLFEHLDTATRAKLEELAEQRTVPAGHTLIRRGERSGDVFRLESGSLEVIDGRSKPELILGVFGPGTVVGEVAFVDDSPRSANVRAGEDCRLSAWSEDRLRSALEADPSFAASFYRSVARLMAERLRNLTRMASTGTPRKDSVLSLSGDVERRGRDLAEQIKVSLVDLEAPLRGGDPEEGYHALKEALDGFTTVGDRFFAGLGHDEAEAAGRVLARELHPYLVRARLPELAVAGGEERVAGPRILAHVLVERPAGSDPLGQALDRAILDLPTTRGLRATALALQELLREMVPTDEPSRVLVVPCGAGTVVAAAEQAMAQGGGELTCVDGDRDTLAFVNTGVAARPAGVRLRLLQEDLAKLAMGGSSSFLGEQSLVVIDGYVDYLPDRLVGSLGRQVLQWLRPGGEVVFGFLAPSPDAFVFDHLLQWRTIRRTAGVLAALLTEVGLEVVGHEQAAGAGRLLRLRRPPVGS